jgi:outer membrane protein
MKLKTVGLWISISLWQPFAFSADFGSKTLEQSYASALAKSETVLDSREQVTQAEEHQAQAKSGLLPTVSASASYLVQDSSGINSSSSLGGSSFQSTQPVIKVTAVQPLFRGFREYAVLKQNENLIEAQREVKHQAELQLYDECALSFFTILSLGQDRRNLEAEMGLYNERIKELQVRMRIGRSRKTEVLTVDSSLATLKSQLEAVNGQILNARVNFAFLTGLPADTDLIDDYEVLGQIEALDVYLRQIEDRPDIKANRFRVLAASENVSVAKGVHWPSIDLLGNYYFVRTGALDKVAWDAQIVLTIPIFSGGLNSSKVREASSQEYQSELALRKSRRAGEATMRSLYNSLQADWAQIKALQNSKDMAETNYKLQTKDYRYGLVTNLEVLLTLTGFHETQRAYDHARYTAKLDYLKLKNAVGKHP